MFWFLTHTNGAVTPGPRGKPQKKNGSIHCERETLSGKPVVPDRCAGTHQMMSVHDGLTHTRDPAHCSFSRNSGRQEFQNTADIILAAPLGNGREFGAAAQRHEALAERKASTFILFFTESTWESHFAVIWVYTSKLNQVWPFMLGRWILAKNISGVVSSHHSSPCLKKKKKKGILESDNPADPYNEIT